MADLRNIPSLKSLKVYSDEQGKGDWLIYDDVIKFLSTNVSDSDQKSFHHGNAGRLLKKDGVKTISDTKYIALSILIKYIFNHIHEFSICKRVAAEIQAQILHKGQSSVGSIYEIYQEIAKSTVFDSECDETLNTEDLLKKYQYAAEYKYYEKNFTTQEWKRIVVFEQQFSLAHDIETLSYDEKVIKRWEFLNTVKETLFIKSYIVKQSKSVIKTNNERKAASEVKNGIIVVGNLSHLPSILDLELMNQLQNEFPSDFSSLLTVGCIENICVHHEYIHLFIQLQDNFQSECVPVIVSTAKNILSENHLEYNVDIVFLKEDTFLKYTNTKGVVQRFLFRDDFFNGTLKEQVLFRECASENIFSEAEKCPTCEEHLERENVLDWKHIDLLSEYRTHIPIFIQILFEGFINKASLNHASDKQKLLKSKISRLYCLYDNLLNILNRNYTGILQELNTDELVFSYHNVGTVFSITSHGGITSSVKTAEKRLSVHADSDITYYNTYIKDYPLTYKSTNEQMKLHANLQGCYLILAIDNLVRLTFKDDTPRGESRSSQLCTLPLTLKGLPKDAECVSSWHDPNICDGEADCPCKSHVKLHQKDLDRVIYTLSREEQVQKEKSEIQFTWGNTKIWNNTDILGIITAEVGNPAEVSSVISDDLNSSIQTLTLEEKNDVLALVQNDLQDTEAMDIPDWDISQVDSQETTFQEAGTEIVSSSQLCLSDGTFGFNIFSVPPLLCRHPPPAVGRDDDINKLKEILDDVLQKSGFIGSRSNTSSRILFAPDHKIGVNLLRLMCINPIYRSFIPEFPLLHLRKSKITTLCSAYKQAGLTELLKYMTDDERDTELLKLISVEKIDKATRTIRRLSVALHTACMIEFLRSLKTEANVKSVLQVLQGTSEKDLSDDLNSSYLEFLSNGCNRNATFQLHIDLMRHTDEILSIYVAERMGGPDGYNLLLATVKQSLPFSFLNGASAYGPFCVRLLLEHYSCGPFYRNMKHTLFTTPHKNSSVNIALDTQREIDHKDALKGFRPRSTINALLPRLSLVDSYIEKHEQRQSLEENETHTNKEEVRVYHLKITDTDMQFIAPVVSLVLRRGGFSLAEDSKVRNIYASDNPVLEDTLLDKKTADIGSSMIKKFVCKNSLCGFTPKDCPIFDSVKGPKVLVNKLKKGKSTTFSRARSSNIVKKSNKAILEDRRKKEVEKYKKRYDCLTSSMNTCQSLVKPDGTKAAVQKSLGMRKALLNAIAEKGDHGDVSNGTDEIVQLEIQKFPDNICDTVVSVVMEFAGVKFKANVQTGKEYLKFVEQRYINRFRRHLTNLKRLVICEEKYSYTPDDFKAATHTNRRKVKDKKGISHLRQEMEVISDKYFNREAVLTEAGKRLVSTYLSKHIDKVNIGANLTVDIDSELHIRICDCNEGQPCDCKTYAIPKRVVTGENGEIQTEYLEAVHQMKGEAEMSQLDWIYDMKDTIAKGDSILSYVTSGDIDAVCIHLFALSNWWPRDTNGKFKNSVYVALEKNADKVDIYNITAIIELLEDKYGQYSGMTIGIGLCIGGNDYIPKFQGITHDKILQIIMNTEDVRQSLIQWNRDEKQITGGKVDFEVFKNVVKRMFCPRRYDPQQLTLEEVRQISIKNPDKSEFEVPDRWMPPKSALQYLTMLYDYQIEYFMTAGKSDAELPDFMGKGCLRKTEEDEVEYYFGDEAHIDNKEKLLCMDEIELSEKLKNMPRKLKRIKPEIGITSTTAGNKRPNEDTPQKGHRRKIGPKTSTPRARARLPMDDDQN